MDASKFDDIHCIKNSYQMIDILKNLKSTKNIKTFDFKDLSNINLFVLPNIINLLFQKFHHQLSYSCTCGYRILLCTY